VTGKKEASKLRGLPSVDKILSAGRIERLLETVPRVIVVGSARSILDSTRDRVRAGGAVPGFEEIVEAVAGEAAKRFVPTMRGAINASGVILHTGLGRAALPESARMAIDEVARGHSTLEIDLETGRRGHRIDHLEWLLTTITGAEAAFAVNNNAAAVMLALNALAKGKEVVISRGELVEIGGSFRMPDVIAASGAKMVEVGTTNKVHLSDYEKAISKKAGAIVKVHQSNFAIVGFTEEVPLANLAGFCRKAGLPVMHDLGSGALVDFSEFGLPKEPMPQESLAAGADVVCFSCDKLMGGPQGGALVGRKALIDKMRSNPLARVVRLDKLAVAGIEATLREFLKPDGAIRAIPVLRMIARGLESIERDAKELCAKLADSCARAADFDVVDGHSTVGGGSMAGYEIPTKLVRIRPQKMSVDDLSRALRVGDPPVIARIADDAVLLDPRTLLEGELDRVAAAAKAALD
jgi:L-seryl-tRNA(Ser) seleniumtransferase